MNKTKTIAAAGLFLILAAGLCVADAFLTPADDSITAAETEATAETEETQSDSASYYVPEPVPEGHGSERLGPDDGSVKISSGDGTTTLTAAEKEKYPQFTNLPTLYITLDDNMSLSKISHDEWSGATYTLVDGENGIVEKRLQIKGRGNYSWTMNKKPYSLKLDEKESLLGMGKGKSWVLIANWSDKTLMRNYITMNFARNIGLQYSSECRYVDVYFNGEYEGNFVLCEKITIGDNRIEVDEKNGGALFEIEKAFRHNNDCTWCIECPSGTHVTFKEPDEEDYGAEWKAEVMKQYKSTFIKADISMTKGYEYYSRYIDVDSFVDWYIVNEWVKNFDSGFTTSCYCYISDKDGKIHMGPVWDYDTCMANQNVADCLNPEGYHVGESPWYSILLKDEDFFRILQERWTFLEDSGTIDSFFTMIEETDEYIADSCTENFKIWKDALRFDGLRGNLSTRTHEDEVEYVKNWMQTRREWLDKVWYIGEK